MPARRGLSLLELLVVVAVLVLISGLTLRSLANVVASDPHSVAIQLQSRLQGLRERARQGARPVSVRLVRDPSRPDLAIALVALQPGDRLVFGTGAATVQFERDPVTGEVTRVRGLTADCDWVGLRDRGHLRLPARIRIPAGQGEWYSISDLTGVPGRPGESIATLASPLDPGLVLQAAPAVVATPAGSPLATCELETVATWSATTEPFSFPASLVIDLRRSQLPSDWETTDGDLDLTCASRGDLPEAGQRPIVLVLRPRQDAERGLDLASGACTGGAEGLVLWPGSGRVGVYPLDTTDAKNNETGAAGADGLADDPFRLVLAGPGGES